MRNDPVHVLTFDIEDWFHILDHSSTETEAEWQNFEDRIDVGCNKILELLAKHDLTATFFILGWVARRRPDLVRRISDLGHEVGTHSDMHQLVYQQSIPDFEEDLRRSVGSLEDVLSQKVTAYRAPGFSIKGDLGTYHDIFRRTGIESDCSIFPASRAHGGIATFPRSEPCILRRNGTDIREWPMSVFRLAARDIVFSGGGYFRLAPFWLIRLLSDRSNYVMTYFHPRDFDPEQPVLEGLSAKRRFKSYYGLQSSYQKLDRWLGKAEMLSLGEAERRIDWDNAPVIDVV